MFETTYWFLIFAALLGAVFGSFANVLVIRMKQELSIGGRSACPSCGKTLRPHHLVPILSWLALGGKCAYCRKPIHIQYPLVEGAMMLLFTIAAYRYPGAIYGILTVPFMIEIAFAFVLVILVAFDVRWQLVPVEFATGAAVVLGLMSIIGGMSWISLLIGILVPIAFFGMQILLSRGKWLGGGDVYVGALLGATLGWPKVGVALYLAYIIGGVAVAMLLILGRVKRSSRIAFVPMLALGGYLTLWIGDRAAAYVQALIW